MKEIHYEEFDAFESVIDSEYFGISCAKVVIHKACLSTAKQKELFSFLQKFSFSIITNEGNDPINNHWLGCTTNAFLTDINFQFKKKVSVDNESLIISTTIANDLPENSKIIQIAETAFLYSHFLNDPYLPKDRARKIYGDITKNSFQKKDRYFNLISENGEIVGFVLFSIDVPDESARIILIAIDPNFTGRKIGQTLIKTLEGFLVKKDIHTLRVGTQFDNIIALNFYTSLGFKFVECNSIYHYWPINFG